MEILNTAVDWIIANPWAAFTTFSVVSSALVKITPTETDDKVLAAVLKFLEIVAMNNKPVTLKKKG